MIEERTRAKEFRSIIMLITGIPIILGSWFTTNTFSVGDADMTVNTDYERSYSLGGREETARFDISSGSHLPST